MPTRHDNSVCKARKVGYCLAIIVIACMVSVTFADDVQKQIDAMRQRLDAVQNETEEMRGTLDTLKAENIDWLTKERAEEIKQLVHDVLSDVETRKSLTGDGILGGWSDGFFLASSDGRFKLKIGGLLQERVIMGYLRVGTSPFFDRWRGGLENTRTRLNISGHIFDRDTTFLVQAGWGWLDPNAISSAPLLRIGPRLWDTWIKFKMKNEFFLNKFNSSRIKKMERSKFAFWIPPIIGQFRKFFYFSFVYCAQNNIRLVILVHLYN